MGGQIQAADVILVRSVKGVLNKTDKVRIVGPGETDLSFSIKGIGGVKCSGRRNIPDGEVYTAPVKDSVNGIIAYNVPSVENGIKFENVRLEFKDGKTMRFTVRNETVYATVKSIEIK